MRRHLTAFAALALAGSTLFVTQSANAAAAAPRTASVATPPLSPLRTNVHYPRVAWSGDTVVYTIYTKNVGQWSTDIAYIGGYVPSQARRVQITGPSGSYCEADGREVGCLLDRLRPGRTVAVKVKIWLRNSARGTATARFASASIDVPAGGIDTLNIHGIDTGVDLKFVTVKTRIRR
ncbi:hypothetical protein [Streptosporangium sp. NPDC051022]|uniref:hypothetical protein n=1 Tax=Streptosporangium sp. NPDC051022 TaxID=3155752 RepID=UPI00341D35BA